MYRAEQLKYHRRDITQTSSLVHYGLDTEHHIVSGLAIFICADYVSPELGCTKYFYEYLPSIAHKSLYVRPYCMSYSTFVPTVAYLCRTYDAPTTSSSESLSVDSFTVPMPSTNVSASSVGVLFPGVCPAGGSRVGLGVSVHVPVSGVTFPLAVDDVTTASCWDLCLL